MTSVTSAAPLRFARLHRLEGDGPGCFTQATAALLNAEWPRPRGHREAWLRRSRDALPTSYILYDTEDSAEGSSGASEPLARAAVVEGTAPLVRTVAAHARVSAAHRTGGAASQVSAIITSVLVSPSFRRRGIGRRILELVEHECRVVHGFGRVVLWTDDQVEFYEKCGYHRCRPLHTVSKAVSRLNANGLSAIEDMLARQRRKAADAAAAAVVADGGQNGKAPQGGGVLEVADACDGDRGASSVWLSKRLVEHFETRFLPRDKVECEVRSQIERTIARYSRAESPSLCKQNAVQNNAIDLACVLIDVPHERQIGPCCGIAALRCIRAYWKGRKDLYKNKKDVMEGICCEFEQTSRAASGTTQTGTSSLLDFARHQGWSSDGEMFHAVNLARLAGSPPGGLSSAVYIDLTRLALVDLIVRQGVPVLISFDKSNRSQEFLLENEYRGARAHWGIVRGIVCSAASLSGSLSGSTVCSELGDEGGTRLRLHWASRTGEGTSRLDTFESRKGIALTNDQFARGKDDEETLFVVLQHTASDQISVVPFDRLVRSNAQLDDDNDAHSKIKTMQAATASLGMDADKKILDGLGYVRGGQALSGRWVVCRPSSASGEI